jgi:hypothetical protein
LRLEPFVTDHPPEQASELRRDDFRVALSRIPRYGDGKEPWSLFVVYRVTVVEAPCVRSQARRAKLGVEAAACCVVLHQLAVFEYVGVLTQPFG